MVGDLIKTNSTSWSEDLKDKYCKVTFLAKNYVSSISVDGSQKEPYGEGSSFDPIPLTPKILEKNEFTLKEDEKGMYGVTIAPYYTRDDVPFEVFCDGEPFAIWFKDPVNIKYVHQLQHALRLCGIEKEMIL